MNWALALGVLSLFLFGGITTTIALTRGDDAPAFFSSKQYRGSEPPSGLRLPSFTLRDYSGDLVRSADLRGKVVIVTFLDSQCTEACPVIAAHIGRTLAGLQPAQRARVEAIAISTDPAEDSAKSVRRFLARQRALNQLRYLTRPAAALPAVWKSFKILSSFESGEDTLHSAPVRVYDPQGVWVSTLHAGVDLTTTNLAHDISRALDSAP